MQFNMSKCNVSFRIISFLLALVHNFINSSSQMIFVGQCPTTTSMELVDETRLHGTWYELERSPSLSEYSLVCIQVVIQQFYDHQAQVHMTGWDRLSRKKIQASGSVKTLPGFPQTGNLIRFNWDASAFENYTLQVVYTDYNNFLLLLGCQNHKTSAFDAILWLLGRSHHVSDDVQASIAGKINLMGLGNIKLHMLPQHRVPPDKVPVLEIKQNGSFCTIVSRNQSVHHVAAKCSHPVEDPNEDSKCDEYIVSLSDYTRMLRLVDACEDGETRAKLLAKLHVNQTPPYLGIFDNIIESNNGHSLAGDVMTWADTYLAHVMDNFTKFSDADLLKSYPSLTNLVHTVLSAPAIK